MKKMYVLALAAVVFSIVAGCKKDEVIPPIVGYWTGTYDGSGPWHMLFRSNGTVRVLDGADTSVLTATSKGEGTYTVSDSVRTYYQYNGTIGPIYSTAAKMNDAATSMVGTYGSGTSTGGGGTIALTK
jgi:hypothetical protein